MKFTVKFMCSYETEEESMLEVGEKFSEMINKSGLRGVVSIDCLDVKVKTNSENKI